MNNDFGLPAGQNATAQGIARAMIEGFERHYTLFRETSRAVKARFEAGDWPGQGQAVKERIRFYTDRVNECVERLRSEFDAARVSAGTWQQAKLLYIGHLIGNKQPELAETFFNSVTTKILHSSYFNNDFIFFRPAVSTEYIEANPPSYRSYYPGQDGMRACVLQLFRDFGWANPFEDLERDVGFFLETVRQHMGGAFPEPQPNCQVQVLQSAFYRGKAAYVIGQLVNGHSEWPFVVPVLRHPDGRLYLDTLLLDPQQINILFSLSRAYFQADMEVPSAYVQYLRWIMPNKPRSELYTMLGLGKQGKTMFIRDLFQHLLHSNDDFIEAPGIRGLVMLVFTLPSYPYVFKVIKDKFGSSKETDRETVKGKFTLVKQVDRVGRMADTLEFSELSLPRSRFTPALIEQIEQLAPSVFDILEDRVVVKHCYIERRMIPLNLFLDHATPEQIDHAVFEYGNAIKELALANIFPGDMLWKNFGVTRYGRVVFYDYDEIEFLTDINFRRIPPAPTPEMEMSGEVWYSVARNDVFPEEFATFLLGSPKVRQAFLKYHRDLLDVKFWQSAQERIRSGVQQDYFPYPEEKRFCNAFASPEARAAAQSVEHACR